MYINPRRRAEDRVLSSERYVFKQYRAMSLICFRIFVPSQSSNHFEIYAQLPYPFTYLRGLHLVALTDYQTVPCSLRPGPHRVGGHILDSSGNTLGRVYMDITLVHHFPSPKVWKSCLPICSLQFCRWIPSCGLRPYPLVVTSMLHPPTTAPFLYKCLS